MPAPFVIEQVTGEERVVILKGRALPLSGAAWESELAVELTWYPGISTANSQVIGNREMPSTFRGRWSDKLLFEASNTNGVQLLNFPAVTPAGLPTSGINGGSSFAAADSFPVASQEARLAKTVLDAVDLIKREGQKVKVRWGSRVRYGFLTRVLDQPGRGNDIVWELDFKWTGRTNSLPTRVAPKLNVLSTRAGLQRLLAALQAIWDKFALVDTNFANRLAGAIAALFDTISQIINSLTGVASLRFAPASLLNTLKAFLQLIRAHVAALREAFANNRSLAQEKAEVGLPDATAIAQIVHSQLRRQLAETAAFAAEQQRLVDEVSTSEIRATFVAKTRTTLRDISVRFYQTPDNWPRIREFNQFTGSAVAPGTEVLIPKL